MATPQEQAGEGEEPGAEQPSPSERSRLELEAEIASLQEEETRMFDFLHDLAEMITRQRAIRRVPELIVNGVARIVKATGAALYLLDKTGAELVPEIVTVGCPSLLELPEELREEDIQSSATLLSYLKLKAIDAGSGPLGYVLREQRSQNLRHLSQSEQFTGEFTAEQGAAPVMLAPLHYGSKPLGVLAAGHPPHGLAFPAHVFDVFRSLAEQSAFALGNAMLQEEAMEKRRMESELRAASEVQRVLLPESSPELEDYAIAADNVAARIVSGDYYDFITVDESHTGVVIADVSGKGIPASLVMTTCRGLMRGMARGVHSPSEALASVNRSIYHDVREDMFISIAYVMLDKNSDEIRLSRAGHDAPFWYSRQTHTVTRLEPPGVAVGVDDGEVFERVTRDFTFTMERGDCLLLFTDGVNEAENSEGELFGLERLEEIFRLHAPNGARAVLSEIQAAIHSHVAGHPQSDDITLIVIEKR